MSNKLVLILALVMAYLVFRSGAFDLAPSPAAPPLGGMTAQTPGVTTPPETLAPSFGQPSNEAPTHNEWLGVDPGLELPQVLDPEHLKMHENGTPHDH